MRAVALVVGFPTRQRDRRAKITIPVQGEDQLNDCSPNGFDQYQSILHDRWEQLDNPIFEYVREETSAWQATRTAKLANYNRLRQHRYAFRAGAAAKQDASSRRPSLAGALN